MSESNAFVGSTIHIDADAAMYWYMVEGYYVVIAHGSWRSRLYNLLAGEYVHFPVPAIGNHLPFRCD